MGVLSFILYSCVAVVIYKFIKFMMYVQSLKNTFKDAPGHKRHWLYGNLHLMPESTHGILMFGLDTCNRYKKYYVWWMGPLKPEITLPEGHQNRLLFGLDNCNQHKKYYVWWTGPTKASLTVCHPETVRNVVKTSDSCRSSKSATIPPGDHDRLMFGMENCNTFSRYYIWWMGPLQPTVIVHHPDTIQKVIKTSEPKPIGFAGIYRLGILWLGEGLLIAGGERWARARRLLTPAFHFDILKPYIPIYNDCASVLLNNLDKFATSKERFEVFSNISKVTLDIILRCAFSYETDCQKEGETHPYVSAVEEISELWYLRARKPWLYPDWIYYLTHNGRVFTRNCDYVHKVAEDIIQQRQKVLEKSGQSDRKYLDFLDILLTARDENDKGLTPLEIRNEVDTFLFEGHDTTGSALTWILYDLATNPECQRKCQAEIDNVLKGRDTDDIEWGDLAKFEYLTMCIKEGMRHHSPVPFIQREFTSDFEVDGRDITDTTGHVDFLAHLRDEVSQAGTTVSLHIYGLHHNKHIWDRPMEYIPDRFSKDNLAKMDNYQFVPFSAGPRNCIGQHFAMNEEKVLVARLLRKFWFEVDSTHEVLHKVAAVMRAENGMYMYVTRRNDM